MTKAKDCKEQQEFRAPDGGWGWMIVIGIGISSMLLISVLQTFGLLFKDRLQELEFSASDTTSLMSMNSSFGMILGPVTGVLRNSVLTRENEVISLRTLIYGLKILLNIFQSHNGGIFNGPLLKRFGYRKIALIGGVLFFAGFFYLPFAETYLQFVVSYGMLASVGTSMSFSSFSLAINTYFQLRRSLASSFSITITGMGPILLPLLITHLLSSYGWKWSALIIAALTLNHFVGALLLQPVKWHLKPQIVEEGDRSTNDSTAEKHQTADTSSLFTYGTSLIEPAEILGRSHSDLNVEWSQNSLHKKTLNYQEIIARRLNQSNGKIGRKLKSVTSLDNEDYGDMMKSTLFVLETSTKEKPMKYASVETLDYRPFVGSPYESQKLLSRSMDTKYMSQDMPISKAEEEIVENAISDGRKRGIWQKIMESIKRMYDLDLLLDPIYINLLIGLGLATVGELMFSLLTPFILSELGLDLTEIALFMSITAVTDVIFRFLAPFFVKFINFGSRVIYLISICELLITRAALLFCESFTSFIVVGVLLGIGKGFRTVYWILVVPDYVPLSKLPSAGAFQSLVNGISLLISGPLIGAIVANNGNRYVNVVFASNCLTFTTIMLWGIEFIIVYHRNKKLKTAATT